MSGNQERGNITADSKKISDDFVGIITKAFEIIDEVSDKIGDGAYLELANHFKVLHDFKNKMTNNIVYMEHERRTRMNLRPDQRRLTLAEKMKNKKYMKCKRCDTIITKKEYSQHTKRQKCKRIYSTKMITIATKLRVIPDTLVILDDMLDTRDGHYYSTEGDIRTRQGEVYTMKQYYEYEIKTEKDSALIIQKIVRGWLVRKNIKKEKTKKEYCMECEMNRDENEVRSYCCVGMTQVMCKYCAENRLVYMEEVDMWYDKIVGGFITSWNEEFPYTTANGKYGLHPSQHLKQKSTKKDMIELLTAYGYKIKNIGKCKKDEVREMIVGMVLE